MSVIIEKSVCVDCQGLSSCMRLKRLNHGKTIRDELTKLYKGVDVGKPSDIEVYKNPDRKIEIFEVIISKCSLKEQYEMRKKRGQLSNEEKEDNTLYYCNICKSMHKESSELGKSHKEESMRLFKERVEKNG